MMLGLCGQASAAPSCSFWGTSMQFGSIDINSGGIASSTGSIGFSCQGISQPTPVLLCFNAYDTPQKPGYNPRYMPILHSGLSGYYVAYNLYKDAARQEILGSLASGSQATPWLLTPTLTPASATMTMPLYGDIKLYGQQQYLGGQNYGHNVTLSMTYMVYDGSPPDCANPQMQSGGSFQFWVGVTLINTCRIDSATNMSFPTIYGQLRESADSTSAISVTCTANTPYEVGLDNGLHAQGTQRRMQGAGGFIQYELYRDPGRNTRWGNTLGEGQTSVGANTSQTMLVYGRVPPQALPGSGSYSDRIVVTVTY
jgi:spore coat protein U-like protein